MTVESEVSLFLLRFSEYESKLALNIHDKSIHIIWHVYQFISRKGGIAFKAVVIAVASMMYDVNTSRLSP